MYEWHSFIKVVLFRVVIFWWIYIFCSYTYTVTCSIICSFIHPVHTCHAYTDLPHLLFIQWPATNSVYIFMCSYIHTVTCYIFCLYLLYILFVQLSATYSVCTFILLHAIRVLIKHVLLLVLFIHLYNDPDE